MNVLLAAEQEILSHPVRRRVAPAPPPDLPLAGLPRKSMGEMTFRIWNRERLALPAHIRARDLSGSMLNQRSFGSDQNLVVIDETRLPASAAELPQEILVPFYLLDARGMKPVEMLYQPARPFEPLGAVMERLSEETGQQYVLSDPHLLRTAAYHLLSPVDRAIMYVAHDQAHCVVQVNNYLVFLNEEECKPENAPHHRVTSRVLRQLQLYSGLDRATIGLFMQQGVLVDERGRSLRRISRMLTADQHPIFPHANPGAGPRWILRFKPLHHGVRLPIWDETALEHPSAEMLHTFRSFQKVQEEMVEALQRTYRAIRALAYVVSHGHITPEPDCPWMGTLRFPLELHLPPDHPVPISFEVMSSLFPERFPRWMYRDALEALENKAPLAVAEQPPGLGVDLFPYQLETLGYMLTVEAQSGMHENLWTPVGDLFYSPAYQRLISTLDHVPWLPAGGFVCEEVGLGKTIEVLALVRANPAPDALPAEGPDGRRPSRATVIVCPVTIVAQWLQMVERTLVRPRAEVILYHGTKKTANLDVLAEADIVLTTYETLAAEFKRYREAQRDAGEPQRPRTWPEFPMYAMEWNRVVFDESHTVRDPHTGKGMACAGLHAGRRWCVSATPFREEITANDDLRSQCAMLHRALNEIPYRKQVLQALGVRHTKARVQEMMPALPAKITHAAAIAMTPEDQQIYDTALQTVRREYERVRVLLPQSANPGMLVRYMLSVFAPLRRFCSTGRMSRIPIRDDLGAVEATAVEHGEVPDDECPICFSAMEEPCRTPCRHWFCRACIRDWLTAMHGNHRCPMCRQAVQLNQLVRVIPENSEVAAAAAEAPTDEAVHGEPPVAVAVAAPPRRNRAVLNALMARLEQLREGEPDAKFLLFSQFREGLEDMQDELQQRGIGFRRLDGSMTLLRRARAIRDFDADPEVRCMILDIRTAAFGLNLTRAHHVLFLDTPVNPAAVHQAVGRAHRTGQRHDVHVWHFVLEGTVEQRIMAAGLASVSFQDLAEILA